MYVIMVTLAKDLYGDDWERNLRRLIRDEIGREVEPNQLSIAEMNQVCEKMITI